MGEYKVNPLLFLRSICAWTVGFLVFSIFFSILSLFASLFDRGGNTSHKIIGWWGRSITWISGIHVHVKGLENIKQSSYVIVANHQSFYDIFVLLAYIPLQFRIIVKKVLFKIPFISMAMRSAGYISIDRNNSASAMGSLKEAIKKIKLGKSILIFPEGTRSRNGEVGEFKRGSLLIASKAKIPVLPISVSGTFNIMPKGTFLIYPRNVYVTLHKPIETNHLDKNEQRALGEKVRDVIISGKRDGSYTQQGHKL